MTSNEWPSDFDNVRGFERVLNALKPLGFGDTSYHNDTCPSIGIWDDEIGDRVITVWVDYRNPELREIRNDLDNEWFWDLWVDFGGFGEPFSSRDMPALIDHCKQAIDILEIQAVDGIIQQSTKSQAIVPAGETK